jgi:hypothetical protein
MAQPQVACPQKLHDGARRGHLQSADVFDGPPERMASLVPDLATWEWDLSASQKYAEQHGERFYLVCRYKGIDATAVLKIPYSATFCKVQGIRNGTYAACTSQPRATSKLKN